MRVLEYRVGGLKGRTGGQCPVPQSTNNCPQFLRQCLARGTKGVWGAWDYVHSPFPVSNKKCPHVGDNEERMKWPYSFQRIMF